VYLIVVGWLYVVLLMAVAEGASTTGTVLGAIVTFLLYGVVPLAIVVYIMGTPGRKRAIKARETAELAEARQAAAASSSGEPDAGGEAPADPVAPVRKEP
jgi:mannose/fructose/N-acetylgalactosamine-specific phosphotransferase system component IID